MAKSLRVVHFYGFYLGRPDDDGWEVAEADEYGILRRSWASDEDADGNELEEDVLDRMQRALLCGAGLTDDQIDDRREEVLAERCGVAVIWHGNLGWPDVSLAAYGSVVESWDSKPVSAARPLDEAARAQADRSLARALQVLGVTPHQVRADWLMAPIYA